MTWVITLVGILQLRSAAYARDPIPSAQAFTGQLILVVYPRIVYTDLDNLICKVIGQTHLPRLYGLAWPLHSAI